MNIIQEYISEMREDAILLDNMACIYPGDPTGQISEEIYLLNKAASWLERINWETEAALYRESAPQVEVTYGE